MISLLRYRSLKIFIIATGSVLFALYLWGNNLNSKWWIIDDHEIMNYLGPDGDVKINEIPALLFSTEVGSPGHSLRYRPSYYLNRIVEAFIWGNSPLLWYLCRLILFAVSAAILWWIVDKHIGIVAGMVFMLYVFTFPYWSDIWAKLGPAETYAVFGVATYCLGYINTLRTIKKQEIPCGYSLINWSLMLLGAVVSMGSKENFLILLIPSLVLFILLWRKSLLDKVGSIYSLIIFGYGMFIAAAIGMALSTTKKDIYEQSVEPMGRLKLVYFGLGKVFVNNYLLFTISGILLFIFVISIYLVSPENMDRARLLREAFSKYFITSVIILLLYISQYVFYAGQWPTGRTRYDFPGALSGPFFLLSTVIFLINVSMIIKRHKIVKNVILVLFSLLLILLIIQNGYSYIRKASQINARRTQIFTHNLQSLVNILRGNPGVPLLFESYRAGDYEPVYAVPIFLRAYEVQNPFYLKIYADRPGYVRSEFENSLAKGLHDISIKGSENYRPISEFYENPSRCYSIGFSAPPSSECIKIGQIW